jgi:hypothetical protein
MKTWIERNRQSQNRDSGYGRRNNFELLFPEFLIARPKLDRPNARFDFPGVIEGMGAKIVSPHLANPLVLI